MLLSVNHRWSRLLWLWRTVKCCRCGFTRTIWILWLFIDTIKYKQRIFNHLVIRKSPTESFTYDSNALPIKLPGILGCDYSTCLVAFLINRIFWKSVESISIGYWVSQFVTLCRRHLNICYKKLVHFTAIPEDSFLYRIMVCID